MQTNQFSSKINKASYYKKTFLYRALRYLIDPISCRYKQSSLLKKYQKNSFDRTFEWNWEDINFNRIALVNLLIAKKPQCAYLEIGCASNALFDSIPIQNKIGVDPQNGGNVRKTSDDFFHTNETFFDVIFIDGLHTYEQVRKDVINSIKFLKPNGWIALHDMLPRTWIEHHVPMLSAGPWTGDVWKVAFELSQTEGVDFKILKIDHGVGVLRLTKNNPVIIDLSGELNDKQFSYFYQNISKLPIVEWNDCQDWLRNNKTGVH